MDWGLHYSKFPGALEGYCDANWVSGNDEVNSTSGYVFTLVGGAVFGNPVSNPVILYGSVSR